MWEHKLVYLYMYVPFAVHLQMHLCRIHETRDYTLVTTKW